MFTELLSRRPRSVLIVDESEDTRAVLRTALERRGVEILEAARAEQGVALARQHQPGVIVIDVDSTGADDPQLRAELVNGCPSCPTPLVLLGTTSGRSATSDGESCVPKPYHFAPLIRRIEALLEGRRKADGGGR